jgi:transglutaminase-like putative cysteine protease
MRIGIETHLVYRLSEPMDLLMQVEVADVPDQMVRLRDMWLPAGARIETVAGESDIGVRMWLRCEGEFRCDYRAEVEIARPVADIAQLPATDALELPARTLRYLMPSRYVPTDEVQPVLADVFPGLSGGALVAAVSDWIKREFIYAPGSSDARTTAFDTIRSRHGVCRDFTHVLIALCRSAAIPARYASVYAPGVEPQDFHAVAEVYLNGSWHLIDPTGMAHPNAMARIGVGMDAAEVAFLTAFGWIDFVEQWVNVEVLQP